ncbi:hypothetical protein Pmani_017760 [Petrolisthes manimaculis]|uniref:LRRNT domain-containing protein n=1 Tax=Petrolisthes manimaculis TaxID=1843537 RepID=A0AAE1PMC9_9EUCA|nr:hypothetical protein Pmani_017760 [Petrolisthes manimaculis]
MRTTSWSTAGVLWVLVVFSVTAQGPGEGLRSCPAECTCSGLSVSCSHRGLTRMPRLLTRHTQRLCADMCYRLEPR